MTHHSAPATESGKTDLPAYHFRYRRVRLQALGELLNSARLAVSIAAYILRDAKACLVSCMQILHKHHHKISFCRHGTLDM